MKIIDFMHRLRSGKLRFNKSDKLICKSLSRTVRWQMETEDDDIFDYFSAWYADSDSSSYPEKKSLHFRAWREHFEEVRMRKRGLCTTSKQCLQKMFPFIEWEGQLEMLHFFLASDRVSERKWMHKELLNHWSIIQDLPAEEYAHWLNEIAQTWQTYQDDTCMRVMVKRFPLPYLKDFLTTHQVEYPYLPIAIRLAEEAHYVIDASQLSASDYLYAIAKTGRDISDEECKAKFLEALSAVFQTIHQKGWLFSQLRDEYNFSLLAIGKVSALLWCLGRLNKADLIMEFYTFDKQVQETLTWNFASFTTAGIEYNAPTYLEELWKPYLTSPF